MKRIIGRVIVTILTPFVYLKKQVGNLFAYEEKCRMERSFGTFGNNSKLFFPYNLAGQENIAIGENTVILEHSRMNIWKDKDGNYPKVVIGNNCYIGYYFSLLAAKDIIIEDHVLFASNVLINSHSHGINPESEDYYSEQPLTGSSIKIGEGCWIGEKVCILPGVTIGKKCIIGANSVVTKSVPDFSIAVGAPARVVKRWDFDHHEWKKIEER